MKLGPFNISRRTAVVEAAAAPTPRAPSELGGTGTLNLSGFLQSSEYNADLTGHSAIRMYDRMMRSDGSVQEAVEHINAPIKNADVNIDPASDDPDDLEIAAMVHKAFFDWSHQPFLELLDQLLDHLWFGHAVFEPVFQVVEDELKYTDPELNDEVDLPTRQFLAWQRFSPRLPETIFKWHMDQGELVSVEQRVWKGDQGYQTVTIPADRLLVLTAKKRGDEYTGRSLLRAAVKPFVYKELIEKIQAIALERWGAGIPVAYPSNEAKTDDAVLDKLELILQNLRAGEFSYVVMPGPKQNGQIDGFVIEMLPMSGSPPDFAVPLAYHRAEIKAAVLARFAELGHASVGARATGDIQSVVWFAALHAVARYLEDVMDGPIRQLVDANYPDVSCYPRMRFSGLEEKDLGLWAQANAQLVSAGAIVPDKSYRGYVRGQIDAPDEDETTEDPALEDPNAPPTPPADNGDNPQQDGSKPPSQQIEEEN